MRKLFVLFIFLSHNFGFCQNIHAGFDNTDETLEHEIIAGEITDDTNKVNSDSTDLDSIDSMGYDYQMFSQTISHIAFKRQTENGIFGKDIDETKNSLCKIIEEHIMQEVQDSKSTSSEIFENELINSNKNCTTSKETKESDNVTDSRLAKDVPNLQRIPDTILQYYTDYQKVVDNNPLRRIIINLVLLYHQIPLKIGKKITTTSEVSYEHLFGTDDTTPLKATLTFECTDIKQINDKTIVFIKVLWDNEWSNNQEDKTQTSKTQTNKTKSTQNQSSVERIERKISSIKIKASAEIQYNIDDITLHKYSDSLSVLFGFANGLSIDIQTALTSNIKYRSYEIQPVKKPAIKKESKK